MKQSNRSGGRRLFLSNTFKMAAGYTLLHHLPLQVQAGSQPGPSTAYTVQDIINLVLREGRIEPLKDTVDTLKSGRAEQTVTGIVTTMFTTQAVLDFAIRQKANFIIAHEPTFYNHQDDLDWVKNNTVAQQKMEWLEQHGIAVWRFHDYCHRMKPDMVSHGVAMEAGWLGYQAEDQFSFKVPAQSLETLARHLKASLKIQQLRVIGDLKQSCSTLAILPGAWGGQRHVATVESLHPDVLIVGELSEWETAEYIRDSRSQGKKTALIVLGHAVSEEPGMKYFAEWLQPKIQGLQVHHKASGSPFNWI